MYILTKTLGSIYIAILQHSVTEQKDMTLKLRNSTFS